MSDKIYCGNGKKKSATWLKVSLNPDVLLQHVKEYKGKKYIPVNINIFDSENKYGKDVSVTIDTWEPSGDYIPKDKKVAEEFSKSDMDHPDDNNDNSDLPF